MGVKVTTDSLHGIRKFGQMELALVRKDMRVDVGRRPCIGHQMVDIEGQHCNLESSSKTNLSKKSSKCQPCKVRGTCHVVRDTALRYRLTNSKV